MTARPSTGNTSDNPATEHSDNALAAIGEALIVIVEGYAKPVPPLPSAGEIDARIERNLRAYDLERALRKPAGQEGGR